MPRVALPTDLTDAQWAAVEPLIPAPVRGGRKREVNVREVLNAIRHLLATDCGWRGLPAGFPNRSTVRHYSDTWRESGLWSRIEATLASRSEATDLSDDESNAEPQEGTS